MLVRFVGCGITMLMLLLVSTSLRAAPDLDLNTRFIQGSFDVLLPDGWVAALDASGSLLLAEGPEFKMLFLSPGWDDNEELFLYHDLRVAEINATQTLSASMFDDSANGPEEKRRSILAVSLVSNRLPNSGNEADFLMYQIQISRPAPSGGYATFASIAYSGEVDDAEYWTEKLESILDSLNVSDPPTLGPPRYQQAAKGATKRRPEANDIVGDWVGEDVLGDISLGDDQVSIVALPSSAPDLELQRNGRYVSRWSHVEFSFVPKEDSFSFEHEESGNWRMDGNQLRLTPTIYEGFVTVVGEEPGFYKESVKVTRQYDVVVSGDQLMLRGTCAEYQMLPDCVDPFTGEPRVLGFVLEQRDEPKE